MYTSIHVHVLYMYICTCTLYVISMCFTLQVQVSDLSVQVVAKNVTPNVFGGSTQVCHCVCACVCVCVFVCVCVCDMHVPYTVEHFIFAVENFRGCGLILYY